jgi:hypothetical protein
MVKCALYLIRHHTMKIHVGLEVGYSYVCLNVQHQIWLKNQLHFPVFLPQRKENPIPTGLVQSRSGRGGENKLFCFHRKSIYDSPVTIPGPSHSTELSRLLKNSNYKRSVSGNTRTPQYAHWKPLKSAPFSELFRLTRTYRWHKANPSSPETGHITAIRLLYWHSVLNTIFFMKIWGRGKVAR